MSAQGQLDSSRKDPTNRLVHRLKTLRRPGSTGTLRRFKVEVAFPSRWQTLVHLSFSRDRRAG